MSKSSPNSAGKAVGVYMAGSWATLQVVDVLAENLGLPPWTFALALVLLLIGLPVVALTAYFHGADPRESAEAVSDVGFAQRLLTWRRAILGGVGALSLLVLAVSVYLVMWATGIGPVGSLVAQGIIDRADPVILAEFENASEDGQLARVVTQTLRVDLEQSRVIRVLPEAYVANVLRRMSRDPDAILTTELAQEVAVREGVKAVIEGEVAALGTGFVLSARIADPTTGDSYASFRETAAAEDGLVGALDRLSAAVREKAGESLRSIGRSRPLAAVTTPSLRALRQYTEALTLEEAGDREGAVALLQEAVAVDTAFAMAHRKLASIYGNQAVWDLRRLHAERAYAFRDRLTEVERHLASAYYHNVEGDLAAAIREYEATLRIDPDESTALNNLGVLYRNDGRLEEAVAVLERAAYGVGESNTAYANLVEDYLELGDVASARRVMERFGARIPEQYWLWRAQALLGIAEGDASTVHRVVERFLTDGSLSLGRRVGGLYYMASVDERLGHVREALRHFDEIQTLLGEDGDPESLARLHTQRGMALERLGDPRLAAATRHLQDRVTNPQTRFVAGRLVSLYRDTSSRVEFEGLVAQAEAWAAARPGDPIARWVQAVDRLDAGDSSSIQMLAEAEAGLGCFGCLRLDQLAATIELGLWERAVVIGRDILERPLNASRAWAHEPEVHWLLAQAQEALGEEVQAAAHYQRLAELWETADSELQPRVSQAKQRAEGLTPTQR